MANNSISSLFTELTPYEQASLSGGRSIARGGRGGNGRTGRNGVNGADGRSVRGVSRRRSGKLSKEDRKILDQTLSDVSDLLSDLF